MHAPRLETTTPPFDFTVDSCKKNFDDTFAENGGHAQLDGKIEAYPKRHTREVCWYIDIKCSVPGYDGRAPVAMTSRETTTHTPPPRPQLGHVPGDNRRRGVRPGRNFELSLLVRTRRTRAHVGPRHPVQLACK